MILEFADKCELKAKLPARLSFEGTARYLYLLRMRPAKYTGSVKVGITCNFSNRMNDCGWHRNIIFILSSLPLSDAKDRERELVKLGNKLSGRSWGSREEEFWLRDKKLNHFIQVYRSLACPPSDYSI